MSRETLEIHVPFLATLLNPALLILNSILKLRFRERGDNFVIRGKTLLELSPISKAHGAVG